MLRTPDPAPPAPDDPVCTVTELGTCIQLSAAGDLDLVDQAELDEIEPQLGVDDLGQRVGDFFDGGH